MSCRTCAHQSVCYLVDSHGLTEMSFHFNEIECSDYIDKDVLKKVEQLEKENKELKELLTPKKPINVTYDDGYIEYWNCPHCHIQHSDEFTLFCDNCGQALDCSHDDE